jgi:hypothetical protein
MRDENGRSGGTDEPRVREGALDMNSVVEKIIELNRRKREQKPGMRNRKAVQSVVDKLLGGQEK